MKMNEERKARRDGNEPLVRTRKWSGDVVRGSLQIGYQAEGQGHRTPNSALGDESDDIRRGMLLRCNKKELETA